MRDEQHWYRQLDGNPQHKTYVSTTPIPGVLDTIHQVSQVSKSRTGPRFGFSRSPDLDADLNILHTFFPRSFPAVPLRRKILRFYKGEGTSFHKGGLYLFLARMGATLLFLFFLIIFSLVDPNPDSESRSRDPIESGSGSRNSARKDSLPSSSKLLVSGRISGMARYWSSSSLLFSDTVRFS
jgi:hypothetical protein